MFCYQYYYAKKNSRYRGKGKENESSREFCAPFLVPLFSGSGVGLYIGVLYTGVLYTGVF